jgi:hypothetical protein
VQFREGQKSRRSAMRLGLRVCARRGVCGPLGYVQRDLPSAEQDSVAHLSGHEGPDLWIRRVPDFRCPGVFMGLSSRSSPTFHHLAWSSQYANKQKTGKQADE